MMERLVVIGRRYFGVSFQVKRGSPDSRITSGAPRLQDIEIAAWMRGVPGLGIQRRGATQIKN